MTDTTAPSAHLLALLEPILARVAALDPAARHSPEAIRELEAILEDEFPHDGPQVQEIGAALARGVREGWLANRGEDDSRFSRVAKAGPETHGLSIDVVSMIGPAVAHTHPQGEVTLGFPAEGVLDPHSCQFEERAPAWVFMPPGSRHIPTVTGARMNLVYFLPNGAVEWHFG